MGLNIGYGFWGFLGDRKYIKKDGAVKEVSTPDGNAFYSWGIISELLKQGNKVIQLMPDRDEPGYLERGSNIFKAWAGKERENAYLGMEVGMEQYDTFSNGFDLGQLNCDLAPRVYNLDFVLWEWRWPIPGRNDRATMETNPESYQPDYLIQHTYLRLFKALNIPVIVFDLDYKLTNEDIIKYGIAAVVELGNKWQNNTLCTSRRVEIPFNFRHINTFDVADPDVGTIYVGNRYERDWCIDKYLPNGTVVHGNWTESNRDSQQKWPNHIFRDRLQTADMQKAYSAAAVTPLLAKRSYCEQGFMTARIIEAVFYGCVPLFIEEFTRNSAYIPTHLRNLLIVKDKTNVSTVSAALFEQPEVRERIIHELRYHLSTFMDSKYFVNNLMELYEAIR